MPSFFSLLNRTKKTTERTQVTPNDSNQSAVADNGTSDKLQQRQSKRDFLRNLLSPMSTRSESRTSHRRSNQVKDPKPSSPNKPISPMPNSNKPLPAPPVSAINEPAPPANAPTKLNRIISPLSIADVHKVFSGAPQFFVRSEGRHTGPPKPSVAFPWDTEVQIRDLCDHTQNEDQAWSSVTAYPHITRDLDKDRDVLAEHKEKQRAYFMPICHERPNMLSMQGLERGTVGFSAALEMGVADALYEGTEEPASPERGSLAERRNRFLKEKKHGVRPLSEVDVIAKLIDIGESYHEVSTSHEKSSVERYTELFTQVLFPPTRVRDSDDPYSLQVQIEALLDVLAVTNIWIDFSIVEWRIRLGQILWGAPYEPEDGNEPRISVEVHDSGVPGTQKFWLLLQILLSCELLIRLDLVTKKAEHDPRVITADAIRRFEEDAKQSVRWSLILARIWLENIRIERTKPLTHVEEKKSAVGWLATLTGTAAATSKDVHDENVASTEFRGRHQTRQISGLVHFARKLHWPEVDNVATKFSQSAALIAESVASTPALGTPLSMTTQRSSYFGNSAQIAIKRGLSKQQNRRSVMMQPSGWLSRSYLTGLILPGEGLSHFLISTLLENDRSAVARLGEEANLYGGFTYSSKSYWSTACIVGRVLAAGKGASECMGWLSSEVLPKGTEDGWVYVGAEMPPKSEGDNGPEAARIWKKHIVEREGHVLGDGDASTILPGDFTLPVDDVPDAENLEVTLELLELSATSGSVHGTPRDEMPTPMTENTDATESSAIANYSAIMTFAVKSSGGGTRDLAFNIAHDVHFVTAHPCVPSHYTRMLDSPSSPSFRAPNLPTQLGDTKLGPHDLYAGHPLHKSFVYKREVLSQILNILPQMSASKSPLASLHTSSEEIFVIDCNEPSPPSQATIGSHTASTKSMARKRHWGSDLEMLARAWCAEKGYNALISRRGRNCIACSIREARALGWKIVLRFG